MKEATMYPHNPNSAESVLTERLKDVSFAWVENQRAIVLEAMQAYADQQVNRVLDEVIDNLYSKLPDHIKVKVLHAISGFKIKQP